MQQRTARVERPLTYEVPADLMLQIGDVVRVPLGPRDVYGYVVASSQSVPSRARAVAARVEGPRAFDEASLALARWMAERYCCSLGEALGAVVFAATIPRVVDRFELRTRPISTAYPNVPQRLIELIADDLADGFTLETLLRHPEARRAGDRRTLLAALGALQRGGALERTRTFVAP
ncbi:MAG: hypothetical protein IAI50_11180, partial [Candidatus Eremiobacteraeota bacterium]|nr:hypothetical protein [Candidatus Eremiobacteraeota bacterium]